jgi:hypothetical protein
MPSVILKDMYRKFNARHQTEYRLLDRLKKSFEDDRARLRADYDSDTLDQHPLMRIVVLESPRRKPSCQRGGPGRPRKSGEEWLNLHGTSLALSSGSAFTSSKTGENILAISPVVNRKGMFVCCELVSSCDAHLDLVTVGRVCLLCTVDGGVSSCDAHLDLVTVGRVCLLCVLLIGVSSCDAHLDLVTVGRVCLLCVLLMLV